MGPSFCEFQIKTLAVLTKLAYYNSGIPLIYAAPTEVN